jgi:hypothetical protein
MDASERRRRRRGRRERSSEQEEAARAKAGYEERDSSDEKTMEMFRRAKATRNNAWCWCLTIEVSSQAQYSLQPCI